MTPEETLRQALLEDKFPESDEKPIVPIADPLKYNRMTAVSAWMGNLTGQDISPEDIGWQAEKDALAQEFFKMPDAKDLTDETVHDLIRSHIQTADNARNIAMRAASTGRSITQALNEVDSVAGVSKTRGIRDRYLNEASTIYGNVATNLAPYRTIIDQAAKAIEGFDTKAEGASDAFTKIAESLLPLPPKERLMVISAIGEVGAATPKDQQAYLLKLVLAMDREAEKAVTGTASLAESLFFAGGAVEMSTMNVPGIAKATAEYAQKRRELKVLAGQVRMMAQSKINPIEGNNWREDTGIGIARMAPLYAATAISGPAAIAVMTGQFRDEATVGAVNAGESLDNAEAIASIAAPIMAGQEFLSNALPLGKIKIPFIDKWLKASTTSIKSAALRVATRGTIGTGTEITEEIMQTVTPLLTQDLLSDWQSEWSIESGISKSDWDERMPKISDIAKGTFGPAFVISFLMAGRISIADVKNSRALMTSPNHMVASGISLDLANQITAEGLKGNYNEVDKLFRQGFDKANKATPEQVKEAEARLKKKGSAALELHNKIRQEYGIGIPVNLGNGKYQFTTPILKDSKGEIIDKGVSAQFNSLTEANEAWMLYAKNRGFKLRKAEQEFITSIVAALEKNQGLDISLMDYVMPTEKFVELFPSTAAQVDERIKLTDQIDGAVEDISLENSVLESEANDNKNYRILGTNSIEQREGISTGVITIYKGGGLLDVIEESAEVGVKRLMSDPMSRTKLIIQIRDVEAKMRGQAMQMGQKHMPLIATTDDNQVSDMEIIEAFSHIAKSYYVQTAKAVERPTFTSDMPLNLYLGSLQSSIVGMELKDAIDLVGEKTLNILYRASQIKAVYDANGMNQDFIDALEKSVGLNVSNRNADAVVDTAAGLAADAGVSMSMDRANTAFSTSRAQPADISNVTEMPDGAQLVGPTTFSIEAYHGTPHEVDRLRMSKIGTGEGKQSFGWGLYFTKVRKLAEGYRDRLSQGRPPSFEFKEKTGYSLGEAGVRELLNVTDLESAQTVRQRSQFLAQYSAQELLDLSPVARQVTTNPSSGNLYTVELLPDEEDFLDWDKPLSEQSDKVKDAIQKEFGVLAPMEMTGGEWHAFITKDDTDPKTLSQDLAALGIPGIRYLDGGSRAAGEGTSNYVIFDENLVKIIEKNGQKVEGQSFSISPVTTVNQIAKIGDQVSADFEKRKKDRVSESSFDFSFQESDDPAFGGDGYYNSTWTAQADADKYLEEFVPLPSIYILENGKFSVGEGVELFDNLQDAKESVIYGVKEYLENNQGSFGANMDGKEAAAEVFAKSRKFFNQFGGEWGVTKWGSWYYDAKDSQGEGLKISIRDHQATRKDMGLPDKAWEVSKNWEPKETALALSKSWEWMSENAQSEGQSFSISPVSEVERITPENKVAPSINGKPAADIFAEVKKRHGVTHSIYEAGYVLPDGTMLDFSGRADVGDFKQGPDLVFRVVSGRDWMKDQRGVDHREIEWQDMPDYQENWERMVGFLRLGAIRVDAKSGMISMHSRAKITSAQASALKSIVVAADGAYIDLEDDARSRSSMQLNGGKWGKVNGLLTRWANGETPEFEGQSFSISPITPAQDAEYLAAVEAGDMAKANSAQDARQKAFDAFREARRDAENILDKDRAKIREGVQIFQEDGNTFWNAFYRGRYNGVDYDPDGSFTIWFDETKGKWMSQGDNGFDSMPTEDDSFAAASDWVKQQFVEDWENQQVDRSFGQFERGKDEAFNILDSFVPPLGIESRQRKPWEGSGGIGPSGSIYGEFAPTGSDDVVWKLRIADHENTSRQHRQPDEQFIVSKSWTPESVESAMQRAYNWLAKQKTTVTFSISRSDFTGRIEQSLRPLFEGSPEAKLKIGMMALKRAQAVAAESLYDVGRAGAAKRKLAEMEASRIKKLAKVTDKTPDWVKKSLEKETTPEQAKAALMKDKLNGWIQMHDAIVSSMPTEIRGTIGSISTLAKLSSDEARLRFIEDRIPKVEKAIEKYLKKGYGERIDKMLEAAAVKGKAGEIPKSKFIVTVQDELNTIIEMTNLSTDDTVKEAARYEAEIISAQTAEDAADSFAKSQLLEVFGDLYGKQTTAEEMDVAHEYLKDLMTQGRAARKVLDEARAAEVAAMVKQAKSDAFAGAANAATVQAGKDKGKGTTKGMMKGLLRELGSHRFVLSSVFGRSNKTADHFDEQMILGVNAFETKQAERKKSLRDFMRILYGTKSKILLDIELEKMETRVERSRVTKMEGEKRESDTKTVEEVERIIKSPSTFGYSAEEAQMWEDEMDAWSNLPTSRKRNLTIERIKVKGTRIEIPLSQMEAVYMAMALRQPGILDQQTVHGYDLITQAELDDFMSDKSKNWLAWFGAEYANEYDAANEVFMRLFNTRMPQIQFYAPLLKNHQGNQAALDPLNSNVVSQSVNPGATKSRRGRTSSLRIESALGVYQSHFVQMDYWINMAEHLRDTQAVMLNPEVRAAIQSEHGDEAMQALSSWVQLEMARGVSKGALVMHSSRMMRNIKSGVAMKALAFNIGTSIKTLSSVFYSLGEIPITRWPVAFARGIQHWSRMWDTNIIQNRLELGGTPEIRHILANRGKAPNIVLRLIENALVYGSTPTQYADAVLTSYSAAMVYGDRLAQAEKAGAGDDAAHKYAAREMEIAVSRTAQPNDWSGRSLIENDASGVFNLLSMFSSDPRQKLGLVGEAIMKRQRGGATNEEVARKVLAYWVIPGLMFQVANAVTRSMFKDDDKEWEVDNFIRAALVGPLQGLFLLGAAAEFFIASAVAYAAEKITGEEQDKPRNWRSSTNPLVDISDQFLKSIQKLPEKMEEEDFLGGAWEIMKAGGALSTPFFPAGAAPGVADRVFKDTTTLFYGKED